MTTRTDVTTRAADDPAMMIFVRLKLRLLGNGLRGSAGRIALFVVGVLAAFYLAVIGFLLLAASSAGDAQVRLMAASFTGATLVLGAVLLPLLWFGIDDSLDPARFALLPVRRPRLVAGMFVAALLSVPALATLAGTAGLLVPAAAHGGLAGLAGQAAGLIAGLLLCVVAGRAVTSAFATMLRSRRVRDLAGILLASLAALVAPLQLLVVSSTQQPDWDQLARAAAVIGWTPLGAPYTVGFELGQGRPAAAAAKLLITVAALAALLWWWSRTVESAMAGGSTTGSRRTRPGRGGAVAQLLPRLAPATGAGAIVAREMRYWWRDAKRRSNLIMLAMIGLLLPAVVIIGDRAGRAEGAELAPASPLTISLTVLFVGAFAASVLANQFGFDGTAYAAHLTIGVPGRRELRSRALAHAVLTVPLLLPVGVIVAVVQGEPAAAPAAWGVLMAGYGVGLAVNAYLSVVAAYALPESSNPFAVATGSGLSKSMLALVGILAAYLLAAPLLVLSALLSPIVWAWLALPAGTAYGLTAAAIGTHLVGRLLDRRHPELLAAITPRR